jgi:hypothetical protein
MTFLNVPYAEKDDARALGARWNPGKKRWYVPPGVALEPFEKWLAKDGAGAGAGTDSGVSARAAGGRVDAAAAKPFIGSLYVALDHSCNPFEPCAECERQLAGSPWRQAHVALVATVAALARPR